MGLIISRRIADPERENGQQQALLPIGAGWRGQEKETTESSTGCRVRVRPQHQYQQPGDNRLTQSFHKYPGQG